MIERVEWMHRSLRALHRSAGRGARARAYMNANEGGWAGATTELKRMNLGRLLSDSRLGRGVGSQPVASFVSFFFLLLFLVFLSLGREKEITEPRRCLSSARGGEEQRHSRSRRKPRQRYESAPKR